MPPFCFFQRGGKCHESFRGDERHKPTQGWRSRKVGRPPFAATVAVAAALSTPKTPHTHTTRTGQQVGQHVDRLAVVHKRRADGVAQQLEMAAAVVGDVARRLRRAERAKRDVDRVQVSACVIVCACCGGYGKKSALVLKKRALDRRGTRHTALRKTQKNTKNNNNHNTYTCRRRRAGSARRRRAASRAACAG